MSYHYKENSISYNQTDSKHNLQVGQSVSVAHAYKDSDSMRIKYKMCLDLILNVQRASKERILSILTSGCAEMLDADRCILYCIDRKMTSMYEVKEAVRSCTLLTL